MKAIYREWIWDDDDSSIMLQDWSGNDYLFSICNGHDAARFFTGGEPEKMDTLMSKLETVANEWFRHRHEQKEKDDDNSK